MDSVEKFKETQVPSRESFYGKLNKTHISERDYTQAKKVWEKFNIKNLGEYHDLYLKTDVLLLADVFETFGTVCQNKNSQGLDPAHNNTAPVLAWSAMLKMTKQNLELISDIDMLLMICSKRYAKANNKYLPDYNKNEANSFLIYYDANNLYGWAMSQSLPYGKLKWVQEKHYEKVLQDIVVSSQK